MNRKLSAVRTARRNGNAIREFIATADPFALDMLIGPPQVGQPARDAHGIARARIDDRRIAHTRAMTPLQKSLFRSIRNDYQRANGLDTRYNVSPTSTHATPYNPE